MQVGVYNEHEALPYSRDGTGCFCLRADVPDRSGFQQNDMAIIFTNADASPFDVCTPTASENKKYVCSRG